MDHANVAWASAGQSLDPSAPSGAVAGQEPADGQVELDRPRSQGQRPPYTVEYLNGGWIVFKNDI